MKILNTDYARYKYPPDIKNLEDFIAFVNSREQLFIRLQKFNEDNCVYPFLIEEDIQTVYVNCSNMSEISEEEVTLLSRNEYELRLRKRIQETCLECIYYEKEEKDTVRGHQGKLRLDGTCNWFLKKRM